MVARHEQDGSENADPEEVDMRRLQLQNIYFDHYLLPVATTGEDWYSTGT